MTLKVGGLFSGVGGIELGFEKAGYEIAWANEIDSKACITYRHNHKHKLYEEDIHLLKGSDLEPVDVLTGGFHARHSLLLAIEKALMTTEEIFF